jgi:hypothetical protein
LTSGGRDREFARGGTVLFESSQGERVAVGIAMDGEDTIVAAVFALVADDAGYPPRRRMEEQQALGDGLEQVQQVVVAANVGEFVNENRFHLSGREAGEESDGRQDGRAQIAQDHRHIGKTGFQQDHRPGNPQAGRERLQPALPWLGRAAYAPASDPADANPARQSPGLE